nr:PREDICTED: uncharacterized protein LOC105675368 [Linepithema humile]
MTDVRNLLIEQSATIDSLKRVLVNFKKLSKANLTFSKTQGRLLQLESLWDSCRRLHVKLLQIATAEEQRTLFHFQGDEFLAAEEIYQDTADTLTDSSINDSSNNCFNCHVLRFLNLASPVANNEALSNTQKFHYLKTSVIGDAVLLINNLRISDANYDSAWQLLLDEFNDEQTLVYSHLHAFVSLPQMKTENINDLKQLRDTVSASIAALNNLGRPVDQWDDILVYLISQKFSPRTRSKWNLKRPANNVLPSYKDINSFLTLRIRGLSDYDETLKDAGCSKNDKSRSSVNNVAVMKCTCCSGSHHLSKCEDFLRKSVVQRHALVRQNKLCFNCLRSGHFTHKCISKYRCSHCRRTHHSLLHSANNDASDALESSASAKPGSSSAKSPSSAESRTTSAASEASIASVMTVQPPLIATPNILLATAWVVLHTSEGRCLKVRALLDQGSIFSFVSKSLCQALRTKHQRADLQIKCFGERFTDLAKSRSVESWPHLRGLSLADPDPFSHHCIHMLIGADIYGSLLKNDVRQGPYGTPTAQSTAFGWILSGPTGNRESASEKASVLNCVFAQDVNSLLQRFWEDKEISLSPPLTEEEERFERHFDDTHSRSQDGRYVVKLPLNMLIDIGDSLSIALSLQ